MNAQRRKAIEALACRVEGMEERITGLLGEVEAAREEANTIAEEETEYYENMPEGLQGGDKGEAAQGGGAIQYIETARDALQELEDNLSNVDLSDIAGNVRSAGE